MKKRAKLTHFDNYLLTYSLTFQLKKEKESNHTVARHCISHSSQLIFVMEPIVIRMESYRRRTYISDPQNQTVIFHKWFYCLLILLMILLMLTGAFISVALPFFKTDKSTHAITTTATVVKPTISPASVSTTAKSTRIPPIESTPATTTTPIKPDDIWNPMPINQ